MLHCKNVARKSRILLTHAMVSVTSRAMIAENSPRTARIRPIDAPGAIDDAAALLLAGELVAFPTETVYGLGADATNEAAVAKIFAAKERPRFNPLISHVPTADAAFALGDADARAVRVAEAFWPGPLTLVLKRAANCPIAWLTSAGLESVALRVPGAEPARRLLEAVGRPVAAPSANRSGRISPTTAEHVLAELGDRIPLTLDGGPCRVGLESTVLDLSGETARLLRPGSVTREALETLIGPVELAAEGDAIAAPGMLASHYAPEARIRLNARERRTGEVFLDFGGTLAGKHGGALDEDGDGDGDGEADADLSPTGDLVEASARLFACLRALDARGPATIAIAPITEGGDPERGLAAAINDRLRRAAAPRT